MLMQNFGGTNKDYYGINFLKVAHAHKLVMYSRRTEFHLGYKKSVIFFTVRIIISVNDVRL